jgi:hypothetical protein
MKYKNNRLEFRVGDKVQNVIVWTYTKKRIKQMAKIADSLNTIWETWKGEIENIMAR